MNEEMKKREDGRLTKEKLLACAERLTAQKGFTSVTSKEICQLAGTNLAAVNYHFGSRSGLYEAMLYDVHEQLVSVDLLRNLASAGMSPREKLGHFIENFLHLWFGGDGDTKDVICLQVWVREGLGNTAAFLPVLRQIAYLKVPLLVQIFSEYTGFGPRDLRLYSAMVAFLAPFFTMSLSRYFPVDKDATVATYLYNPRFVEQLKVFVFAGLDAVCQKKEE